MGTQLTRSVATHVMSQCRIILYQVSATTCPGSGFLDHEKLPEATKIIVLFSQSIMI
jgi:hypothetical protein